MIRPKGYRVLVKQINYDDADDVFKSAKAAIPGFEFVKDKNTRYQESVDIGVVIAIGPTAWKAPEHGGSNWAEVGETVVFAKHAGKRVEDPEDKEGHYVILNDEDIVAGV